MDKKYIIKIYNKQLDFIGYYQSVEYPNEPECTQNANDAYNFSIYDVGQFLQNMHTLFGNILNFVPEEVK